ncbi:OLC1v1020152C1 [Oldenlandia corymbosa var. corymbosa]|uniref:OLC1v1020152C1 n=1 Tax=Oldenlandia corymbosa var. corymbosa TaxID=529605 RepID=A0AAV1EFN3_OLDCO|nr:OLC1v1020152C1 [Oldenlandia corymbosa var. corymbosa]
MDGKHHDQQLENQKSSDNMAAGKRNKKKPNILLEVFGGQMGGERKPDDISGSCRSADSASGLSLSTNDILKMARKTLIQRRNFDVASILFGGSSDNDDHPDSSYCLSPEMSDDFELAKLFQGAVLWYEKRDLEKTKWWLNICQSKASASGNALHRIVSYFSSALQAKIARELGENPEPDASREANPVKELVKKLQPELMKSYQLLPFCQITDFTAIQALVDNVASARRVHLVDLGIKSASHWPVLMQALAARHDPVELLKLTAVGTAEDNETGRMLSCFAESMNIPFEFRLIVSDLKDLREDMFELSDDEVVAVYSELHLASLLPRLDHLVSLLRTIENLNPLVMVVIEIEAYTDTPIFLERFDAALSVCAAVFDCLEDCVARDNPCRGFIEGGFIWDAVRNVIICEGEERITRHERLDFWRGFLSRFGFVEVALSDIAFCQLNMVVESNPLWKPSTWERNGQGIIVGWKKTPIKSLSVWKFLHE